jgi:hypothetical protein
MIFNALNIIADKNAEFKALKKRFTAKKYMIMKPDWLYRFTLEGIFDYKNFDQTMSELKRSKYNRIIHNLRPVDRSEFFRSVDKYQQN